MISSTERRRCSIPILNRPHVVPDVNITNYDTFAQHLYNRGAFNVNSTSIEAWAMFLASGTNEALPILDILTADIDLNRANFLTDPVVSRFTPLIGDQEYANADGQERWQGHRRLTPNQIMTLAENVVAEVQARGPFQSVSEFVNRQLVDAPETGNSGVLQTAIDNSDLNRDFGYDAPKNILELNGAGTGNTSDGAATQITQGDLLNRLAPSLTVRGDTFCIRAYGETEGVSGETSKAWCEAVFQRQHKYVDDTLAPTEVPLAGTRNESFGRRFKIVFFAGFQRMMSKPDFLFSFLEITFYRSHWACFVCSFLVGSAAIFCGCFYLYFSICARIRKGFPEQSGWRIQRNLTFQCQYSWPVQGGSHGNA